MLPDGVYDVFVVDVEEAADDGSGSAALLVDLTIVAGDHKGEVVSVRATGLRGTPVDLIGLPGTMTVTDGRPSISIDA